MAISKSPITKLSKKYDDLAERLSQPLPPAKGQQDSVEGSRRVYLQFLQRRFHQQRPENQAIHQCRRGNPGAAFAATGRPTTAAPFEIYRALRSINPSPYMYYLDFQDFSDNRYISRDPGPG